MDLLSKTKTEIYEFTAKSTSSQQADYVATLTVKDGEFETCKTSIGTPGNREQWAFFALVAAKINQICKDPIVFKEPVTQVVDLPVEKAVEYSGQEP